MIWQDLMLDRWVDEAALRAAMASAFDVSDAIVAIVDGPEQLAATPPSTQILLERTRQHRDFPLQILVILRDGEVAKHVIGFEGTLDVTRKLAERLDAVVLFAEGSCAPSEWVRVRPTGTVDVVSLDVDESDEVDSFFAVSERPFHVNRQTSESSTRHVTA